MSNSAVDQKFAFKRINIFNIRLMYFICTALTLQGLAQRGLEYGKIVAISTYSTCVFSTILYFFKINDTVKSTLICYSVVVGCCYLSYVNGGQPRFFFVYLGGVALATLYFRRKVMISFAVLFNVTLYAYYRIAPTALMGPLEPKIMKSEFMTRMIIINLVIIVLIILASWGTDLIISVQKKEEDITQLYNKLKFTFDQIEESTGLLGKNINSSNDSIQVVKESSNDITTAMDEISRGIEEEAGAVTGINLRMSDVNVSVAEIKELMNSITETSSEMHYSVGDGIKTVSQLSDSMAQIDTTVNAGYNSIEELRISIDEIDNILEKINHIAKSTHLLALNATIEAAKAGEFGRGFSVIASDIQKLSKVSSVSVKHINSILKKISEQTQSTYVHMKDGENSTRLGKQFLENVKEKFALIISSSSKVSDYVNIENEKITKITESFDKVCEQTMNIASISQEHAAATQEVLAQVEDQNSRIVGFAESLGQINDLSNNLKSLVSSNETT